VRAGQLLQRGPALQQFTAYNRIQFDLVRHLREIHLQGRLQAVIPAGLLIHHLLALRAYAADKFLIRAGEKRLYFNSSDPPIKQLASCNSRRAVLSASPATQC
jgi:hypothetical protein